MQLPGELRLLEMPRPVRDTLVDLELRPGSAPRRGWNLEYSTAGGMRGAP